jgi:class 3 adenylate cyclase
MICPNCGFDSPSEMRFCGQCGLRLKQICPVCNFANPDSYNFCGMCGVLLSTEPVPGQFLSAVRQEQPPTALKDVIPAGMAMPLEGERRLITVILADVANSTELLEQIGSEAWVEIMNHTFQIMEAEIYRLGGTVDQFRGDGLVAFFGATSAHEDDPERAVLAGLAIQESIKPYIAVLAAEKKITLELRVGINTGEVIVTHVGDRSQYSEDTAMGKAVALAARMETAAKPGTVLVSENTYMLVHSHFEWLPLGEITVKGFSRPIAVYQPLSPQAGMRSSQRLHIYGLTRPLIGREIELTTLKRCIQELKTGRGNIVMIMGDKGVGKSQLVTEVRQYVLPNPEFAGSLEDRDSSGWSLGSLTWLTSRCRSYDQAQPYSVWRNLLWSWLGIQENESNLETAECLYDRAQQLWGDQLVDYYPYLATFLSLPLAAPYSERIKYLDAEGLQQQFYRTIRSWLETLARRSPLVLGFGDIHWADATSLDLLEYCLPLTDHGPLLWLITFRPERTSTAWEFRHRAETAYPHRVTTLNLMPLTEAQSEELIDRLIGSNVLAAETRTLILRKAEGNPYYIEELIRSLIEQGVLVQDSSTGQWQITRAVVSLDYLPDTLQSLLLARINGLSLEERRVLQLASVIGSVFWSNLLEVIGGDKIWFKEHLTALQRAQLIYERGRVPHLGVEYVFKSNLVRDAIYESILTTQRVRYHRQVAEFLETQFGQDVIEHLYGMLAHHYQRAEERGKELLYTHLAAQQAKRVYANTEALELYSSTLALLEQMKTQAGDEHRLYAIYTQQFEVLNERREVYHIIGEFEASRADAQALLPLARQLNDDPVWLIDALLQQPGVTNWISLEELQAGLPMAEEALMLAQQLKDLRREMQCLLAIANQRLALSDLEALTFADQALKLARQLEDPYYEARILIWISQFYSWSNEPERGQAYLQAALPVCQMLDDKMAEADLLGQIGLQLERQGDYYRLLTDYHQQRLRISREIGHHLLEAHSVSKCAEIQGVYLGDYKTALTLAEEARSIWRGTPDERFPLFRIIQMLASQARYDEALIAVEWARQVRVPETKVVGHVGLFLVSAILYNTIGDETYLHLALESVHQAQQFIAEKPFLTRQYEMAAALQGSAAHLNLAKFTGVEAKQQNHYRQALVFSQTALEIYEKFGFTQIIECTSEEVLFRHSQALAANERLTEATEYCRRAYQEMMRKYHLIPPDSPFRQTFLENISLHRDIQTSGCYTTETLPNPQ